MGPYNRFALWTQGCPFSCAGCMTPDSQSFEGGQDISVETIAELILNIQDIEGITITGGEPFAQSEPIVRLLKILKKQKDFGVIVYSGYTMKQLNQKNSHIIKEFLNLIDTLIDGKYIEMLNDGKSARGSSNQQICQLTSRYDKIYNTYCKENSRNIELHLQKEQIMVVGIPKKDTIAKLNNFLLKTS